MKPNPISRVDPARRGWLALGIALLLAMPLDAPAAAYLWDGGGNNASWGTANNWNPNGTPTFNNTADLTFEGAARPATYIAANRIIRSLIFSANADTAISIRLTSTAGGAAARNLTMGGGVAPSITIDAGASAAHTLGVAGGNVALAGNLTIAHNGPANFIIDRPITGAFNLTKTGTGTLTLSGANTFSGGAIVSNGTLLVMGSLGGAGQVIATNSGTLGGTGTVAGAVFIYTNGALAPGSNAIGILTLTNGVTFTGGTFKVNAAGTNSGGYGQVKVTGGNVIITNATLAVNGAGYTPVTDDALWILNKTNAGAISGVFNGLPEGGTTNIAGRLFAIYYNADFAAGGTNGGNDALLKCLPPPACQTQPATLVEYTTATLNGLVTKDSGAACQYRFQYGTTTNYSANTPWSGSVVSGNTFGASVAGLQSGTVYNCRAQLTNSAGLGSGSNVTFRTKPPFVGWKSPDGSSDPFAAWSNDTLAYDTNTGTYASDNSGGTGWGSPLWLTLNETIKSDRVRVFSDFGPPGVDLVRMEIRLQPSGVWSNVFEGSVANAAWNEISYATTNIDAARYTFHYTANYIYWLYEFEFYVLPDVVNVPVCETSAASSVEETTAIMHGALTDDGGVPCQYRFQYGLTQAYTTNTPWTGSLVSGEAFSLMLTGLASNTTFHYRAQARNSAGVGSGNDTNFTTVPPGTGWISPTDFSDPGNKWTNAINVFDDNTASMAKSYHNIGDPVWGSNLTLIHSTMQCDAIRFMALDSAEIDMAAVDVFRNGAWTNVFSNTFPDRVWQEAWFSKGTATQARIRFSLIGTGYGMNWELNEFDFHRVNDVTIKGAYDSAHPVTLAVDGVVKGTFTNFTTNVFTFNPSLGAGARILLYYDDDNIPTNSGALVTRATGDDMTNLNLSVNTLVLRGDYNGQLGNADLAAAASGDPDVPYRAAGTDISVTNNIATWITSGCAYVPGANTLSLRHNLIVDGALDNAAGTVAFDGATAVSGTVAAAFCNVAISGSLTAPAGTMTAAGNWVNNGVFFHNDGQVAFDGASAIGGSSTSGFRHVTISGILTAPPGALNVAGNWTNNGTFIHNGGTVVFNGTGTVAGAAASTFNHLTVAAGASLTAPAGAMTVEGNWRRVAGSTFAHNGGTMVFAGAGVSTNFGSTVFNNLQCATPGKQWTFEAGATQTVQGTLTLAGDSANMVTLRSSVPAGKWSIAVPNGAQTVSYVSVKDSDALNNQIIVTGGADGGNNNTNWVFLQNRYWVGGAGDWTNLAHWSAVSGGAGGASVPSNNTPVIFDAASGAGTCALTQPVAVKGILMDTGNGMTLAQGTNAMTLGASGWEQRAGTFTGGAGPLILAGSFQLLGGAFTAPSNSLSVKAGFTHTGGTFAHNGGTVIFAGDTTMSAPSAPLFRNVTISSNGVLWAPSLLRLAGSLTNDGAFNANGGEVRFEGAGAVAGAGVTEFANVTITADGSLSGHPAAMRLTGAWANNGAFNAAGGTVVFAGATQIGGASTSTFNHVQIADTLDAPIGGVMGVAGNWTNNGTFNANNGTVVFSGATVLGGANATYFNSVLLTGTLALPADSVYIAGNLTNNGTLSAGSGTVVFNGASVLGGTNTTSFRNVEIWGSMTAPAVNLYVSGNWVADGAFSHNSGTVVFDGTTLLSGVMASDFNNMIVSGIVTLVLADRIGTGSAVAVYGALDLAGKDDTIGSLSGSGPVLLGGAALTIAGNSSTTFGGPISQSGSLVKQGSGVLTLSGTNTYNGSTVVSGGKLRGTTDSLQGPIVNNAEVIFDQSFDGNNASGISGAGSVTKNGSGAVILAGVSSYAGTTTVSNGALLVNGALGGAGQVIATNSGTLGGTGTVAGAVFIYTNGALAPGSNAIGILTLTNGVTFTGGTFKVNAAGTNSGGYGQVKVTGGNVIITNATLAVNGSGYTPANGDYLWIVNNTGAGTGAGAFDGLPEGGTTNIAGRVFAIYYNADFPAGTTNGGNDALLAIVPAANPTTNSIPWRDDFESYANGTPLINGVTGWYASASSCIVQTNVKYTGSQAALIPPDVVLSNRFVGTNERIVRIEMYVQPQLSNGVDNSALFANVAAQFFVNSNGHFVVGNGTNWSELTNKTDGTSARPITNGCFTRVQVNLRYKNHTWNLKAWTNGADLAASAYYMNFTSNLNAFGGFNIDNRNAAGAADEVSLCGRYIGYLDDVSVTNIDFNLLPQINDVPFDAIENMGDAQPVEINDILNE